MEAILEHQFFNGLNIEALLQTTPPFVPDVCVNAMMPWLIAVSFDNTCRRL
jgi:hypothetical protein